MAVAGFARWCLHRRRTALAVWLRHPHGAYPGGHCTAEATQLVAARMAEPALPRPAVEPANLTPVSQLLLQPAGAGPGSVDRRKR